MGAESLTREIEAAIGAEEPFGPRDGAEGPIEVPAEVVREVLIGRSRNEVDPGRLWLRGVRVKGGLGVGGCRIGLGLRLERCEIESIGLEQAEAVDLAIVDSVVRGEFAADQLTVRWNLVLDGTRAECGVSLDGARLGGRLSMNGATLKHEEGGDGVSALSADGIEVGGNARCHGFEAIGEVRLQDARIEGVLNMAGANLQGVRDDGGVRALNADRIDIGGSMLCRRGFTADGEVRLLGAKVGGQLSMSGAKLTGERDDEGDIRTLNATRIEVGGSMRCGDGFTADGEVRLLGAKIGGQLSMSKSTIRGQPRGDGKVTTLGADGAAIGGDVFCDGMHSTGTVRLLGAKVGGQLSLKDATLTGAGEDRPLRALNADRMEVGESVFCSRLTATGEVRLPRASVGSQISMRNATLKTRSGTEPSLNLFAAEANELILGFTAVSGRVDLRQASVDSFWDAEKGRFMGEQPSRLRLDGFTYRSLREPLDAKRRIEWLAPSQEEGYYPGVYIELASAFRRIGHDDDAREVAIAGERRAGREYSWFPPRRILHWLLGAMIGYGYRNWRALGWLSGLVVVGAAIFCAFEGSFAPARCQGREECEVPDFEPILYAIDVTVPVLEVGQQGTWVGTGAMPWVSLVLTLSGYVLATAVIAAVAGLLNREHRR